MLVAELEVLDESNRLLDADSDATVNTSMLLTAAMWDAAALQRRLSVRLLWMSRGGFGEAEGVRSGVVR